MSVHGACPDGGTCHHACPGAPEGAGLPCSRVLSCGPLTIAGFGDDWPAVVVERHREADAERIRNRPTSWDRLREIADMCRKAAEAEYDVRPGGGIDHAKATRWVDAAHDLYDVAVDHETMSRMVTVSRDAVVASDMAGHEVVLEGAGAVTARYDGTPIERVAWACKLLADRSRDPEFPDAMADGFERLSAALVDCFIVEADIEDVEIETGLTPSEWAELDWWRHFRAKLIGDVPVVGSPLTGHTWHIGRGPRAPHHEGG